MPSTKAHLDWIDSQQQRMLDRVIALCRINSGSDNPEGLARCAKLVAAEVSSLGLEPQLHPCPARPIVDHRGEIVTRPVGDTVLAHYRPSAARQVLLNIHYDTVYGPDSAFQDVTRVDDNTLVGPGVADAKGGIIVLLTALEALMRSDVDLGAVVLLNGDEEVGSYGATPLLNLWGPKCDMAMVFEPAGEEGQMVEARKGSASFHVVIHGRSAHAGREPGIGRNALQLGAEFAVALAHLAKPSEGLTINLGRMDGGGPLNVVPALGIVRFNVRSVTPQQFETFKRDLNALVEEFAKRDGFRVALHGFTSFPPKPLDEPTARLKEHVNACAAEIGFAIPWRLSGGASDANRLAAAGLPCLDTFGPCGGRIHSPEEFLIVPSLVQRAKLAALYLLRFVEGAIASPRPRPLP